MKKASPLRQAAWRQIRILLLVIVAYLLQMNVMPFLQIADVSPNLLLTVIAIVSVGYGRVRAFWVGAVYGLILETMQPTRELFSLLLYPLSALLGAMIFADKSMRTLEYERSLGRAGRNTTPYLRTPLCAMVNALVFEIVNVTYIYLREGSINAGHIGRGVLSVVMTVVITVVLMYPIRRLLGFRTVKPEPEAPKLY